MKEKQKTKLEKQLKAKGFMREEDQLLEALQCSYKDRLVGKMGSWKTSWIHFTEERIIVPAGPFKDCFIIPYESIKKMEKCNQMIFPFGIAITYEKPGINKTETDYFAVSKRDKWIEFISGKSGISLS